LDKKYFKVEIINTPYIPVVAILHWFLSIFQKNDLYKPSLSTGNIHNNDMNVK
jgi:hypothetical protein